MECLLQPPAFQRPQFHSPDKSASLIGGLEIGPNDSARTRVKHFAGLEWIVAWKPHDGRNTKGLVRLTYPGQSLSVERNMFGVHKDKVDPALLGQIRPKGRHGHDRGGKDPL